MASKGTCKAEACEKEVRAKGYCDRHYRKWRKGLMGKPRHRSCNEKGCGKEPVRRGLCPDHYEKTFAKKAEAPPAEAPKSEAPKAEAPPTEAPAETPAEGGA